MSVVQKSKFIEMKQAFPTPPPPPPPQNAPPQRSVADDVAIYFLLSTIGSGGSLLAGVVAVALAVGIIAGAVGVLYVACMFISILPTAYLNFNAFGRRILNMHDSTTLIQLIKGVVVSIAISKDMELKENQVLNESILNAYIFRLNRDGARNTIDKFSEVAAFYNDNVTTKGVLYQACGKYVNMAVFVRNKNKHYKLHFPFGNQKDRKWLLLVDDNPEQDDDIKSMGILTKETSLWGGTFEPRLIIHDLIEVEALLIKYKPQMDLKSSPKLIVNNAKKQNIVIHKAKRVLGRVKKVFRILKNDGATLSRTGTYTLVAKHSRSDSKEGKGLETSEQMNVHVV